jgi:hypothetical protein
MSRSVVSVFTAGVLLAAGAQAADIDAPAAAASTPHAKASDAGAANRSVVKIFVTMRDDGGKVLGKVNVRIEADDSPDIGVGPEGGKLSLPANKDASIKVLFPGGNCSVALTLKAIAGGRAAIGVDRAAGGTKCTLEDVAQAGKPASAPAGKPGRPASASHSLF